MSVTRCIWSSIITLVISSPVIALDLSDLPVPERDPLGELRLEEYRARVNRDWEKETALRQQMLQRSPGNGDIIRKIAFQAEENGRLGSLIRQLQTDQWDGIPEASLLDHDDRLFLRAVLEFSFGHYESARQRLTSLLERRPDWPWAHYYQYQVERYMAFPRRSWESHLEKALRHPETVSLALRNIGRWDNHSAFGEATVQAQTKLSAYRHLPFVEADLLQEQIIHRLLAGSLSPELCDSLWSRFYAAHPTDAMDFLPHMLAVARPGLYPNQTLALIEGYQQAGHESPDLAILAAGIHYDSGEDEQGDAILDAMPEQSASSRQVRLKNSTGNLAGEVLLEKARTLPTLSFRPSSVRLAIDCLAGLGLRAAKDSLESKLRYENPVVCLEERLARLSHADPTAASRLLDSLRTEDVFMGLFDGYVIFIGEKTGDTLAVSDFFQDPSLPSGIFRAMMAASVASAKGHGHRAERIYRAVLDKMPTDLNSIVRILDECSSRGYENLADEVIALLQAQFLEYPAARRAMISAYYQMDRYDEARTALRAVLALPVVPASLALDLIFYAQMLGDEDLANYLVAIGGRSNPENPAVRRMRAWLHQVRGEKPKAVAILEDLVTEFPGVAQYREQLVSAGGAVLDLPQYSEDDDAGDAFALLAHDFESISGILQAMPKAQAIQDAEAAYLLVRGSLKANSPDHFTQRLRETIQCFSEGAVEAFQTFKIPFLPRDGVPRVLVARVVSPNGDITPVPRGDILVVADDANEADISDQRYLAVPFPDLDVGDVLDLVWEYDKTGGWDGGWSYRHTFGAGLPILNETLEFVADKDIPVRITRQNYSGEESVTTDGNVRIYTWTSLDQAAISSPELGPPLDSWVPWIGISTFQDWDDLTEPYSTRFWLQVGVTDDIRRAAKEITQGLRKRDEKLAALYSYVESRIRSLAIELDRGRVIPTPADEVMRRGYGDCKDKVALMVALLDAAGIRALPALVAPRPGLTVLRDFPESSPFSHMILYLPDIDGGLFCDPMLGGDCHRNLPTSLAGCHALVIHRDGDSDLRQIASAKADNHGYTLVVDLLPITETLMRIEIKGDFRGRIRSIIQDALGTADTGTQGEVIDRVLGYGLWDDCHRESWRIVEETCESFAITATYTDSVWCEPGGHSVTFRYITEAADPFLAYPEGEERELPVEIPYPFLDEVTLRFHWGAGWHPGERIAPISVKGKGYKGSIKTKKVEEEDQQWIEIQQRFELTRTRFSAEEYRQFAEDWLHFTIPVYQVYHYRKDLDRERLAQMEAHVRENPSDMGFAMQATYSILGKDMGGDGEDGICRRAAARRLLQNFVSPDQDQALPFFLLANVEGKDRNYYLADSLADQALARDPSDIGTLAYVLSLKRDIQDVAGEIAILERLQHLYASSAVLGGLARAYYSCFRDEDARAVEERIFLLGAERDSATVMLNRFLGYIASDRQDEAGQTLSSLKSLFPENIYEALETDWLMNTQQIDAALEKYRKMWKSDPVNAGFCNNLAWVYALSGQNLERAEELAKASLILADDPTSTENTLATIYARQGHWDRAKKIFQRILEDDDRPTSQIVNQYFLGLCEYQLGKESRALEIWRGMLDATVELRWIRTARESLRLHEEGRPVMLAIFSNVAEDE